MPPITRSNKWSEMKQLVIRMQHPWQTRKSLLHRDACFEQHLAWKIKLQLKQSTKLLWATLTLRYVESVKVAYACFLFVVTQFKRANTTLWFWQFRWCTTPSCCQGKESRPSNHPATTSFKKPPIFTSIHGSLKIFEFGCTKKKRRAIFDPSNSGLNSIHLCQR